MQLPFETLMMNYSNSIQPGIQLGKENGLTLLLDAEVYDYAFSPQKGEGFKLAIHSHMDQPIMALSDIDLSPGESWVPFIESVHIERACHACTAWPMHAHNIEFKIGICLVRSSSYQQCFFVCT